MCRAISYSMLMKKRRFTVLFVFLSIFLAYSLYKNYLNYHEKQQYINQIKQKLHKELEEYKKLVSEYAKSQDYMEIEYIIREKLNLSKPEEKIYIIDRPSPTPTPTPTIHLQPIEKWIRLIW